MDWREEGRNIKNWYESEIPERKEGMEKERKGKRMR